MGVEIKQTVEREFDVELSVNDIRHMTLRKLQEMDLKFHQLNCYAANNNKNSGTIIQPFLRLGLNLAPDHMWEKFVVTSECLIFYLC